MVQPRLNFVPDPFHNRNKLLCVCLWGHLPRFYAFFSIIGGPSFSLRFGSLPSIASVCLFPSMHCPDVGPCAIPPSFSLSPQEPSNRKDSQRHHSPVEHANKIPNDCQLLFLILVILNSVSSFSTTPLPSNYLNLDPIPNPSLIFILPHTLLFFLHSPILDTLSITSICTTKKTK